MLDGEGASLPFSPLSCSLSFYSLNRGGEREREKGVVEKILDKGGIIGQPKTFWGAHLSLSPSPPLADPLQVLNTQHCIFWRL